MTREVAIERLNRCREVLEFSSHMDNQNREAFEMAIKALEQEPGWIPISERLPEECKAVLIWCPERKNIYCAYLEEKQWWIFGAYWEKVTLDVTAWMPLPEPYTAESEE